MFKHILRFASLICIIETLKSNVVGRASRGAGSTLAASRPASTGAGSAAGVFPVAAGNGDQGS
jgi:hypothetical protein